MVRKLAPSRINGPADARAMGARELPRARRKIACATVMVRRARLGRRARPPVVSGEQVREQCSYRGRQSVVAQICYYVGMTKELTLRQAGGSVSATLPKDMADRLRLEAGDRVLAVETDRGILLTPYDPDAERALRVAAKAAKKYRNALRELAR